MSARRPNQGSVVGEVGGISLGLTSPKASQRLHDGTWRPDLPYTGEGLRITMRRAAGVTDPSVLKVPLRFQAPVVGDLARDFGFNWSTYDTLRAGQRGRPMGRQLQEIPLSTLLLDGPAQDSSSGVVVWPHKPMPLKVIDELKYIAGMVPGGKATPFRLTIDQPVVWGNDPVVNTLAVLTRVKPTQKSEETGTEYLDLTFLEFVEDELGRRRQPRDDEKTRYHDLTAGDSLYDLAQTFYHQPSAWKRIAESNGIKGVRPGSESELATWAARHHKKRLRIPPKAKN